MAEIKAYYSSLDKLFYKTDIEISKMLLIDCPKTYWYMESIDNMYTPNT